MSNTKITEALCDWIENAGGTATEAEQESIVNAMHTLYTAMGGEEPEVMPKDIATWVQYLSTVAGGGGGGVAMKEAVLHVPAGVEGVHVIKKHPVTGLPTLWHASAGFGNPAFDVDILVPTAIIVQSTRNKTLAFDFDTAVGVYGGLGGATSQTDTLGTTTFLLFATDEQYTGDEYTVGFTIS